MSTNPLVPKPPSHSLVYTSSHFLTSNHRHPRCGVRRWDVLKIWAGRRFSGKHFLLSSTALFQPRDKSTDLDAAAESPTILEKPSFENGRLCFGELREVLPLLKSRFMTVLDTGAVGFTC